ncbi:putative urea active transporter 1 [Morus notabilis]|uniref:Putative urea active transporter 1 n=1 Tax=Morus notabilis TaxID=981085 RepID=W9RI82_9ROSA|nr:putative urea active transporter 1 [Morus notabilis]
MAAQCPPYDFSAKYYHTVAGGKCERQLSFFEGKTVLNQSVGYAVVLGFGAFFAVFTSFLVWLEKRYIGARHTSEWFNTAGRKVKTGMIASAIVSQWTWAATILQSSNVAWQYGVSGPFWYASGATIQACPTKFFSFSSLDSSNLQVLVQSDLNRAMTMIGTVVWYNGHRDQKKGTPCSYCLRNRKSPLGHSSTYCLSCFLLYDKYYRNGHAASWRFCRVHVVLVIFVYLAYVVSDQLGSPSMIYNRLLELASKSGTCGEPLSHHGQACGPVSGNYNGSYLTMLSSGGFVFGIINIVGNFGTVFVDNGYWVSAIAARPSSTHKGYLLGGLVWFAVPFSLATSLGLGALALNLPITESEAGHGLVPPATAIALMGKGGAVLLLTMLFMAVTSAGSSELIAVSSLCTYDIYRTYINPDATGKKILQVSRYVIFVFGCFMGLLAVILNKVGVSLGWMYLAMGVLIGSAVLPIAFMLLWRKANAVGAISGAISGCVLGIVTWLLVAKIEYGHVNLNTTGRNAPMLAGNLVSILIGGAVHAVCSFLWPQNYDWSTTKQITVVEKEKSELPAEEFREEKLVRAKSWIVRWGVGFTMLIAVVWPALSLPAREFSLGYFTFWSIIAVAWGTIGSAVIIALPIVESWETIKSVFFGMLTNDRLMEKVDELNLRLHSIILSMPEAERIYLQQKDKAKKKDIFDHQDNQAVPSNSSSRTRSVL